MHKNSVKVLRDYLDQGAEDRRFDKIDGSIAAHLEEEHRRVCRINRNDANLEVRVSPAVQALRNSLKARQEVWG